MNKRYLVWYGSIWLLLTGISLFNYGSILAGKCYFQSSNLLCESTLNNLQKLFVFCIWMSIFVCFIFFGRYLWRSYLYNEILTIRTSLFIFCFFAMAALVVPFGSSDTNYYFAAGRTISEGLNPYTDKWVMQKDFFYPVPIDTLVGFSYGPIIATSFRFIFWLSGGNLIWFIVIWKLTMLISLVICADITYRLARVVSGPIQKQNFYIAFALQPMLLFEWVTNGHFDVLWLIFVIGAMLASHHKKWWLAVPLVVVGVWIKFIPLLISPVFILWWWQMLSRDTWKRQVSSTLLGILLSAIVTVVSWYPYWKGMVVFQSVVIQSKWAVISLFAVFYYSLKPVFESLFHAQAHWYLTRTVHILLLGLLVFIVYPYIKRVWSVIFKRTAWSTVEYIAMVFIGLTLYLFIWQKSFLPWYGAWFIPFAIILISAIGSRRIFKIAAWISSMPFMYYMLWLGDWLLTRTDAGSELWFYIVMVAVVAGYPLYLLLEWRAENFVLKNEVVLRKKYCFIITSLIFCRNKKLSYADTRSVFSPEERYRQTLQTIDSIRRKVPDAFIFCVEAGLEASPFELAQRVDEYLYVGGNKIVRAICDSRLKSLGEAIMMLFVEHKLPVADRYFKISGRYYLNDNFSLQDWERGDIVYHFIRSDYISTRLYSFSKGIRNILFGTLLWRLPYFLRDNAIENILARFTPVKYVSRVDKVGISGLDSTNGAIINE